MRRMITMLNLLTLMLTSVAGAEQERDLWYAISIAGARSGWLHETRSEVPEGWQTEQESKIEIRRGAQSVSMQVTSRFVEGKNGKPVRAESIQKLAGTAITTTWTFLGNGVIKEVSTQLGRTNERDIPPSDQDWLSPVAAERFFLARVASGAKNIRWSTVVPDQGPEPVELTRTLVDETTFDRGGRAIPATRWKSTTSAMPGSVGEDLVASDGVLLRQVTSLPFGEMRVELTDEATARMASENVPELLVSLFVQLEKPIQKARMSRTLEISGYNMFTPIRARRVKDGLLQPFIPLDKFNFKIDSNRQKADMVYFHDCGVSVVRPECIENYKEGLLPQKWMGHKIFPLIQQGGLDIDYKYEIPIAEGWLKENGFTEKKFPYRA